MALRMHTHRFRGETSLNDDHNHYYEGETSASPDIPGHTHHMTGRTEISDYHLHQFDLTLEPEADINGGHDHYYRGLTAYNGTLWRDLPPYSGKHRGQAGIEPSRKGILHQKKPGFMIDVRFCGFLD